MKKYFVAFIVLTYRTSFVTTSYHCKYLQIKVHVYQKSVPLDRRLRVGATPYVHNISSLMT